MSLMNPYGTIIEGIGNELLFVLSCMGTILFLIVAWVSTRVNWELMPVRITLLRHLHSNHDTGAETTNAPGTVEPDNIDSSGNIFAESSGSSSEDEINSDTCVHKRSSVQTSVSLTDQRNSSSSDEESKKSRTKENGKINSTSCSNGHLVIKLQYLNEESRFVHASPTMSVNRFKKKHFVDEIINQKKNVRLIFQGRELLDVLQNEANFHSGRRPRRQRLCDYGVTDGSTIHCLVTTPVVSSPTRSSSVNDSGNTGRNFSFPSSSSDSMLTEFDIGTRLMKPLFAFLLLFTWFFRIVYRQYFNSVSTFALVTLTVFFCGAVFTATLVNVVSTIASLFGISNSNELSNQQSENPINQPDSPDVQVLTVTMVARRVPPQTSVNQTNSTSFFLGESAHNHQIIVDEPNSESQTRTD
uniref:Ubiquitin-like domain-containing protein n=2 Tax=Schistosoma mansoni TaxID=6183 RepID=A0A5K4ENI8_SCHMA